MKKPSELHFFRDDNDVYSILQRMTSKNVLKGTSILSDLLQLPELF